MMALKRWLGKQIYMQNRNDMTCDTRWQPTTKVELCAWIGMRVYMNIVHMPNSDLYWLEDLLSIQKHLYVKSNDVEQIRSVVPVLPH